MEKQMRSSPYKWVVLATFMFINLTIQMLWISYAPISLWAAEFYGVSDLKIGLLAMSFMIAFIPLSVPISWSIDTWGVHKSVGLGAAMMGIFGLLRGFAGQSYTLVLLTTFGLAASQPFLLNSWTSVPAKWFPSNQRATAVGLVTLGNLIGTALGMVLTPILVENGMAINTVQLLYGAIAALSALLFILFYRDSPKVAVETEEEEGRALVLDGLKNALTCRPFWYTLAVAFVGLGIFNGITTWIESIIRPRGFAPTDAGTLGALMIAGGLFGAIIIPALSDRKGERQKYLYVALLGALPGLAGLTFATNAGLLFASAFVMGFFLVSALPIAMQYAAEITAPTPEGTSNGLIQLFGQGAVVFVYVMDALKTQDGSFTPSLLVAMGFILAGAIFVTQMKDAKRS
ncbi:MAG: MFS transporter [Spirochaetales bacterium]|nr:MFS transporter [Spirochaetales bacterium]